jgi:multiple sugar transport system ATP-binding protein
MTMADRIAVMRDGVLQQVDTPQHLYNHPANVFVAGFIGSPSMNFFEASLTGDSQEMYVDTGVYRIRLDDEFRQKLSSHAGDRVILGIRPEDIHHPDYLPAGVHGTKVTAAVELTELMGSEIFAYMIAGEDQRFIGKLDPRSRLRTGDSIELLFDTGALHIFDPKTETSLLV